MVNRKMVILIPSCDNYSDMWPLLAQSYEKFRKDCPYEKYIITNSDITVPDGFIACNVGPDVDRSTNCKKALHMIDAEYVLMHIDDLLFIRSVSQTKLELYLSEFFKVSGNYLKLFYTENRGSEEGLGKIKRDEAYRTSTVFSVWRSSVLQELLIEGESPWSFEVDGTDRSKGYDKWFYAPTRCFNYINLVIKGKIERRSYSRLKSIGLSYVGYREKMSYVQNMVYFIKNLVYVVILKLPPLLKNYCIKLARKVG